MLLIWSSLLLLFIRLQIVRKFGQLYGYYASSDNPIRSPSTVFIAYVNVDKILRPLIWSSILFSLTVSRMYVNSVNGLNIRHLIIPSLSLHMCPGSTWTWSFVLKQLIWLSNPDLPRMYVNLANCFKTTNLIIQSQPLQNVRELGELLEYPSSDHPSHPSSVSRLYVNLVNCLNTPHLIIPFHPIYPSPGRTWTWSNI